MNVMVTGGSGFIGSAVMVELETRGHTATRFDRADGNDILDVPTLEDRVHPGIDSVIHLAGVLGTDELFDEPRLAVRVNVTGALNVLEACRRHRIDYVGISMPDVFPSIYTATKVGAQRLAEAYGRAHGFGVIHVVAFNAFGEGQAHGPGHPQKIVPTFATCAAAGLPVPVWGDGLQTVDLIYVAELARVLVEAAEHLGPEGPAEKMNVVEAGTAQPFTVIDVARMVAETLDVNLKVDFLPMRRGERPSKVCSHRIGWDDVLSGPPVFDRGELERTVRWYAERFVNTP